VRCNGGIYASAILIPNHAIVQRNGRSVAFVMADGKAQLRELQLGLSDSNQTEVLSGLEPGDQLIIAGQETLNDGDAVRATARPQGADQGSSGDRREGVS
jgi:hypothetical protein